MPISKANQRAVAKYSAAHYEEIKFRVYKGERENIKAHAEMQGESVNAFIQRAVRETMERDKTDRA